MNKMGFTLVELLAVIVLIGLLTGIGIPGISKISENMKKKSFDKKVVLIEDAGIFWGQDNKSMLQNESSCETDEGRYSCYKITIKALIEEDYLESENYSNINPIYTNSKNDKNFAQDTNCFVYVYKKNNRVTAYFGKKSCSNSID